jgi:hypothetical protein
VKKEYSKTVNKLNIKKAMEVRVLNAIKQKSVRRDITT